MREATINAVREDARRRAHEATERLGALNQGYANRPPRDPNSLQATLEILYARFVSRWTLVKP
jgi:hypothetical protein